MKENINNPQKKTKEVELIFFEKDITKNGQDGFGLIYNVGNRQIEIQVSRTVLAMWDVRAFNVNDLLEQVNFEILIENVLDFSRKNNLTPEKIDIHSMGANVDGKNIYSAEEVGEIIKRSNSQYIIERIPVQSSNLATIGYDSATEILEVEFLNGSVYEYKNVSQAVYNELMNASSHGSYFNREIKKNYPCKKKEEVKKGGIIEKKDLEEVRRAIKNNLQKEEALNLLKTYTENTVKKLNPKEQKILEMRFGLVDGKAHSASEIGEEFDIPVESVEETIETSIEKMKKITVDEEKNSKNKTKNVLTGDGYIKRIGDNIEPGIGVKDLSPEIAQILVDMNDNKGSIFGIFGKWGRGKTFLINQIDKEKLIKKNFHAIYFHAWKYQDTPACWAYLYEALAKKYYGERKKIAIRLKRKWKLKEFIFKKNKEEEELKKNAVLYHLRKKWWGEKILKYFFRNNKFINILDFLINTFSWLLGGLVKLPIFIFYFIISRIWELLKIIWLSFYRHGFLSIIIFFVIVGINVYIIKLPASQRFGILENINYRVYFSFGIDVFGVLFLWLKHKKEAFKLIKKYTTKKDFIKYLGAQHEIQEEIKKLFNAWLITYKKVLLVIDDLDRCSEEKIIQIVDSLRIMLEDKDINNKIVIVIAIDGEILERAIRYKYSKLYPKDDKEESERKIKKLTREYMDKLFLCGIKLGDLTTNEKLEILDKLTAEMIIKEEENENVNLINTKRKDEKEEEIKIEKKEENIRKIHKHRITVKEKMAIAVNIKKVKGITPRQEDIFIFRYLLARNILRIKGREVKPNDICMQLSNYMDTGKINENNSVDKEVENVLNMVITY